MQLSSNLSLPGVTDSSADRTLVDFQAAQALTMEAAAMSQNPPHPLSVWWEVAGKWHKAVEILASIPEDSPISQAQEKLKSYQANYSAIANRIVTEEKAAKNLEKANQLAQEAASLIQTSPNSQTTQEAA